MSEARNFLVPITQGRHQRLTAGVLDDRAMDAFSMGQCLALAVEYIRATEPNDIPVFLKLMFQVDPETGREWFVHAYVVDVLGRKIDVRGVQEEIQYVGWWAVHYSKYRFRLQLLTVDDVKSMTNDEIVALTPGSGPKQRFDVARHFVEAVMAQAGSIIAAGKTHYLSMP